MVTSYVWQTVSLVVLLIMLLVSGALAYVVTQYRRVAEVRARVQLLQGGEQWQRRAVALLEERQLPYRWAGKKRQEIETYIDGKWRVVTDKRGEG